MNQENIALNSVLLQLVVMIQNVLVILLFKLLLNSKESLGPNIYFNYFFFEKSYQKYICHIYKIQTNKRLSFIHFFFIK